MGNSFSVQKFQAQTTRSRLNPVMPINSQRQLSKVVFVWTATPVLLSCFALSVITTSRRRSCERCCKPPDIAISACHERPGLKVQLTSDLYWYKEQWVAVCLVWWIKWQPNAGHKWGGETRTPDCPSTLPDLKKVKACLVHNHHV